MEKAVLKIGIFQGRNSQQAYRENLQIVLENGEVWGVCLCGCVLEIQ